MKVEEREVLGNSRWKERKKEYRKKSKSKNKKLCTEKKVERK